MHTQVSDQITWMNNSPFTDIRAFVCSLVVKKMYTLLQWIFYLSDKGVGEKDATDQNKLFYFLVTKWKTIIFNISVVCKMYTHTQALYPGPILDMMM